MFNVQVLSRDGVQEVLEGQLASQKEGTILPSFKLLEIDFLYL
jgi:hypothetical protein